MDRLTLSSIICVIIIVSAVFGLVGTLFIFAPPRMKLDKVGSALMVLCIVSSLAVVALAVWWLFL